MHRTTGRLVFASAVFGAALLGACSESTTEPGLDPSALDLSAAFSSIPAGYSEASTSFAGSAPAMGLWTSNAWANRLFGGSLMGGGLRDEFLGGTVFGDPGRGRGPRGDEGPFNGTLRCGGNATATFNATTQRVECPSTTTDGGLTIARSAQYRTTAGAVQQAFDTATTNSVNLRTSVTGTVTLDTTRGRGRGHFGFGGPGFGKGPGGPGGPGGAGRGLLLGDTATVLSATTTVQSASDRTTGGLATGSTRRTVDGTSTSQERTTGTSSRGAFTAQRTAADTTRGLVVPVPTSAETARNAYPTAGTVVRVMTATVTFTGQTPTTVSRREVVTYDGSATARVVITENGTTRTCTRPLPRGPLTCQ